MGLWLALQVFGHEPKYWTNWHWPDDRAKRSPKVLQFILKEIWMSVQDFMVIQQIAGYLTKSQKCQPHVGARGEIRGSLKSNRYIKSGGGLTDQLTDIPTTLFAFLRSKDVCHDYVILHLRVTLMKTKGYCFSVSSQRNVMMESRESEENLINTVIH